MIFRHAFRAFVTLGPALALALSPAPTLAKTAPQPVWAFEHSDLKPDPAWHFGRLANGMRYVLRHNATPKGEVVVRMQVAVGSLDEGDAERGFAHFVEHMAFQGSTRVAQGEMVRLLERKGLAFGADTNAFTNYETTTYHLDLPNNAPDLVDTALMLMRETAGELLFDPASVARERGVILSEKRDRNTWSYRESQSRAAFLAPQARYTARSPIGTEEALGGASADSLRAFWRRNYVPAKTTLIVVGDVDVAQIEALVLAKFADWQAAPSPEQPDAGPINPADAGRTAIYLDPSLSEHITVTARKPWRDEKDTLAQRHEVLLRYIGYSIVNRRLQHMARRLDAPFRNARFGSGDIFHAASETTLNIDAVDGRWRRAMVAAATEMRRTLEQGVSEAEIAEQFAVLRAMGDGAAERADTMNSGALTNAIFNLLRNGRIPAAPRLERDWLLRQQSGLTPQAVRSAMKRDAVPLTAPLILFTGRRAPFGSEQALRAAWDEAMAAPLPVVIDTPPAPFAYTDFGAAGQVVADTRDPALGIRQIRFANNVRLNLKRTDLAARSVIVHLSLDGGQMLATRDNPLAVEMTGMMGNGALGKHSLDDLETLTAGRGVTLGMGASGDTFFSSAAPRLADLRLQLEMMTALITDPGYRPEAENLFRQNANTLFLRLRATPSAALSSNIGGILSDNDPRFTLQPVQSYRALSFARLARDISDRLKHGAIEIGIVGDIDEDKVIAEVARTFGALPAREADFGSYAGQRQRPFTSDHSLRQITHTGPKDQALIQIVWPTRDDSDPQEKQVLNLLQRITRIQLTENLRQRLGRSYSPTASSEPSRVWKNYGTFAITASVDVASVDIARKVIGETVAALRDAPPSEDLMQRARQPLLESIDNALKTNGGWMGIVARAQTQPDQIERHLHARERLLAVTPAMVQASARRYLGEAAAVPVVVVPDPAAAASAAPAEAPVPEAP